MNIGLLSILHNREWDFRPDMAQTYAGALRNAIELQLDNDIEKQHGYFLSKKGYKDKDGKTVGANFEDKLYVGNIYRVENHLYWNDEELQDDDQIINVVVVDGPITRDGGGCSYGSKDWRDQVLYANTIPQVVGHLFLINTPGGEASARNDYEMLINDCRNNGKPTVAFVDGMCCSSGVYLASQCDRVIVMNQHDEYGCIGTMAAFWAVAHDTVDQDGYRYVELVGKDCPEKNAWWREAAKGEYEKLQADLDKDTVEFHNTVRENRPLVTDDMLSGKVFEAQEVIPALVDEIGDMERAIECVFALANEEMQAARFMTAPEPEGQAGGETPDTEEPEEKTAGDTYKVEVGGATSVTVTEESATPKNNTEMTDEEKKAAEAEAAQVAAEQAEAQEETPVTEEAPATEEAAGEAAGTVAEEAPATEEETATEETPAGEAAGTVAEEAPATEEETDGEAADTEGAPAEEETAGEAAGTVAEEAPATEEQAAGEAAGTVAEEAPATGEQAAGEAAGTEEAIAEKDKEIASLKESLATLQGIAEERDAAVKERNDISASLEKAGLDYAEQGKALTEAEAKVAEHVATIEKLKKEVADLKAEVKELSGKETPMVDAGAGIPAGNATGEAPKQQGCRVRRNMSYEEVRKATKK